jgi:hypothetical protein
VIRRAIRGTAREQMVGPIRDFRLQPGIAPPQAELKRRRREERRRKVGSSVPGRRRGGLEKRGTVAEQSSFEFAYPLHPSSVRLARLVSLGACRFWRVGEARDSAALTVSELVGNAVRAGRGEQVLLRLSYSPRRLRVEVCDEAPEAPRLRPASTSAESGRGLSIVNALAVRWGTKVLPRGKCVWAEFALPG